MVSFRRNGTLHRFPASAICLPQHVDEHGPKGPILLAVDQELGEGAAPRIAPELADPLGPLEVGEHEDVEQLGAGSLGSNLTCVAFSQRSDVNLADDAAVASLAARGRITVVR